MFRFVFPLILLLTLPLSATTTAEVPAGKAASRPDFSATGKQALELLQKGDPAGGIALLEAEKQRASISLLDQALLGALYLEVRRPSEAFAILGPLAESPDADPAVLYNAGRAALELGKVEIGEQCLERSAEMAPGSPAARKLGLLRGGQGRAVPCLRLLSGWLQATPEDVEARAAATVCALQLGRPEDATALIGPLPKENPRFSILHIQLLILQRKPEEALELIEPLLANHPPEVDSDLRRLAAEAYINTGQAEKVLEIIPEGPIADTRFAILVAEAQYRTGRVGDAIATLERRAKRLLEVSGKKSANQNARLLFDHGRNLLAAGRSKEAIPFLEKAIDLDANSARGWKSYGDALIATGRREEAKVALQRFQEESKKDSEQRLRADSGQADPTSRTLLEVQQALDEGDPESALGLLRREIALVPSELRPRLVLTTILLMLERTEDAERAMNSTLEAFPDHPDAVYQSGVVALAGGDRAQAEVAYSRALEIHPEHTPALNDLGVLLLLSDREDEARQLFERALEINPEDPVAKKNLEDMQ